MNVRITAIRICITTVLMAGCSHAVGSTTHSGGVSGSIPPLPKIHKYHPVAYSNPSNADPFTSFSELLLREEAAKDSVNGAPAVAVPSSPLQRYAVSSLKLTGVVRDVNGKLWVIMLTPKNRIYRADVGVGIGVHNGRITSITDHNGKPSMVVMQYIPNAFGGSKPEKVVVHLNYIH